MSKLLASCCSFQGERYYTNKYYSWYDDGIVSVLTVTGDDDWDCYNGTDSENRENIPFENLPEDIQKELKEKLGEETKQSE